MPSGTRTIPKPLAEIKNKTTMIEYTSKIRQRQNHYFKARDNEFNGKLEEAIEEYQLYSESLDSADKHIPYQWISKLYSRLGNKNDSLKYLEMYGDGCSPPKAAEVFKELGELYEKNELIQKALSSYQKAIDFNPNIGVKKKIESLKKKK